MEVGWLLLSCAWKAAVVVVLGVVLLRHRRCSSAAERHAVWAAVVVALLVLPVLSVLWHRSPLAGLLQGTAAQQVLMMADTHAFVTVFAGNEETAASGVRWLAVIWMAGVTVSLLRLAAGYVTASCYLRGAKSFPSPMAGRDAKVQIVVSPTAPVPMVVGIFRPHIVLPPSASEWDAQCLQRVLTHEAEHIRRKDPWWKLAASITVALYWFHPLVWLAARAFATECEHACDDAVLASGSKPSQYAADLIAFARRSTPWSVCESAIPMASPTRLELRIEAILDETKPRQALRRRSVMMYTIALTILLLPLSALQTIARANPAPGPDATSRASASAQPMAQAGDKAGAIQVSGSAQAKKIIRKVNPRYPVDAKEEGVSGLVRLKIRINKDGAVVDAEVEKSPDDRLSASAVEAIKQWVYEPTVLEGKPVEVLATVDVNFALK